jgi:hypothetical protein
MEQQAAQEQLEFIKKVIEDSRKLLIYDGKDMIVWGLLVAVGMIMMYARFETALTFPVVWLWVTLIGLGWLYSIWKGIQKTKIHRVSTFSGKMMASIWIACGVSMTITGFGLTTSGIIQGPAIIPIMSLFMGVAYFTSGTVLGMRYLYVAGFSWWGAALLTAFWPGSHTFLIFGLLIIFFHLIPGVLFYKKWKSEYLPQTLGALE